MRLLEVGDLLLHGTVTYEGVPNIIRVVKTRCYPSSGFEAVFVDPRDTRQMRLSTDRVMFVWDFEYERLGMRPYDGLPELVEHPPGQMVLV